METTSSKNNSHAIFKTKTVLSYHSPNQSTQLRNMSHPVLILIHKLQLWVPLTGSNVHPPHSSPYFVAISVSTNVSFPWSQNHFSNEAWSKIPNFLTPNPSLAIGEQTILHLTKWYLNSTPKLPNKDFLCSLSKLFVCHTWELYTEIIHS